MLLAVVAVYLNTVGVQSFAEATARSTFARHVI